MARFAVGAKVGAAPNAFTVGHIVDAVNGATTAADQATVAADVATLVADGATPTQAHVTTLNTDWTAFIADIAPVPANADVVLSFDAAAVLTKSQLRLAVEAILRVVDGSKDLTP